MGYQRTEGRRQKDSNVARMKPRGIRVQVTQKYVKNRGDGWQEDSGQSFVGRTGCGTMLDYTVPIQEGQRRINNQQI